MTRLIEATTGSNPMMTGPIAVVIIFTIFSVSLWLMLTRNDIKRIYSIQTALSIFTLLCGVLLSAALVTTGDYSLPLHEALSANGVNIEEPVDSQEAIDGIQFSANVNNQLSTCWVTLSPDAQRDVFDFSRLENVTKGTFVVVCDPVAQ